MASKSLTDVPEQTHDAMRAAARRPVSGPAASPAHAAGGGLEIPGATPAAADVPIGALTHDQIHEPIPGERDAATLTHRQPGAMGGAFNGEDAIQENSVMLMEDQTIREHVREGGGDEAERRLDKQRDTKGER